MPKVAFFITTVLLVTACHDSSPLPLRDCQKTDELKGPAAYPAFAFDYPRPEYSVKTDEIVITNGDVSGSFVNNGPASYLISQLRRILTPPFLLNNNDDGTLVFWGYDDSGYHAVENKTFSLNYSLRSTSAHVAQIEYGNVINRNWAVDFEYSAVPTKRVIVAQVRYRNTTQKERPLTIACNLINPQITKADTWTWWNPPIGAVSARYNAQLHGGAIETANSSGDAFLVFGLDKPASTHAVTTSNAWNYFVAHGQFPGGESVQKASSHFQYLSHAFGPVKPGESVTLAAIIAIDKTKDSAQRDFTETAAGIDQASEKSDAYWTEAWKETNYEVVTPDDDIDRMSALSMSNAVASWDDINDSWVTAFSKNARGVNYLWDNGYAGFGFLFSKPSMVLATLRNLVRLDWRTSYAYSIPNKQNVGVYYAYNHAILTDLVYNYVALTGDSGFLREKASNGKTVLDILDDNISYIHNTLQYDFGGNDNLLEVVSTYVHEVPDLVAATYRMALQIQELSRFGGRPDIENRMPAIAATAHDRTNRLWDSASKWFRTGEGHIVFTCQIFNMLYSGALSQPQCDGLLERRNDFIFGYGTRSLAAYDPLYVPRERARGDWDGPGNYIGNVGNMLRALSTQKYKTDLLRLAKGVATWFKWRPWQPQGIEAETGFAIGSIARDATNTCVSRFVEVVPIDMLGLRYTTDGLEIHDALPPSWHNQIGRATYRGMQYAVKVSVPFRGHKYTFYADKPLAKDSNYAYASIYDANGNPLLDNRSHKFPVLDRDLNIVLHFDSAIR